MINVMLQAVFDPLKVFNRRFDKRKFQASLVMVIITVLLDTVIGPIIFYYVNRDKYEIHLDIGKMFLGLLVSIMTWLVVCLLFWTFSKTFNKGVSFVKIASTWGLSYIPNFFCIILYYLLIIKPEIYNGSGFVSFILSSFFIMFLNWKAIYYFMIMRVVLDTNIREIIVITTVSALVFTVLLLTNSIAGIQVPML